MSDQTLLGKTVTDMVMSRRTFLKWSAVLGGTAALAQGGAVEQLSTRGTVASIKWFVS